MTLDKLLVYSEFIASAAVIFTVIYLAIEVHQTTKTVKAQFGHSLTSRLFERYFQSAKEQEFCQFLAKSWSNDVLEDYEYCRITLWINTCLLTSLIPRTSP